MQSHKVRTSQWAQQLLSNDFLIFDFETTGLDSELDRVVQIGVVDGTGKVILDTLVKPCIHILPEATQVHGITNEMVSNAPTWGDIYPAVFEALDGKVWVAYNLAFDVPFLIEECTRHGLKMPTAAKWPNGLAGQPGQMHCAMNRYAAFWGERRWKGGFTWQKLTNACHQQGIEVNGAHSSAGDCLMTLALIKKMAGVE